jgi:hypothetical protein
MQSKKWQSRETGNTGHTRRGKIRQKHNTTTCVGHHYTQTNTNKTNFLFPLLVTIKWKQINILIGYAYPVSVLFLKLIFLKIEITIKANVHLLRHKYSLCKYYFLFATFGFLVCKDFWIIWSSDRLTMKYLMKISQETPRLH